MFPPFRHCTTSALDRLYRVGSGHGWDCAPPQRVDARPRAVCRVFGDYSGDPTRSCHNPTNGKVLHILTRTHLQPGAHRAVRVAEPLAKAD